MIYKREAKILRLLKSGKPIPKKLFENGRGIDNLLSEKYIAKEYITPPGEDMTIKYVILPKGIDALSHHTRQRAFNIISLSVTIATLLLTLWSLLADNIFKAFN